MTENWKPFKGFELVAEVSDHGRVRTLDSIRTGIRSGKPWVQKVRGKVVRPYVAKNGYPTVAFKIAEKRTKALVHRAVGHAFVPGFFEGATINHRNGIKTDNHCSNLEWCSRAENTSHQWRTGLVDIRGEKHPSCKLSNSDVSLIKEMLGQIMSVLEIAKHFSVSEALIYKIKSGKRRA